MDYTSCASSAWKMSVRVTIPSFEKKKKSVHGSQGRMIEILPKHYM